MDSRKWRRRTTQKQCQLTKAIILLPTWLRHICKKSTFQIVITHNKKLKADAADYVVAAHGFAILFAATMPLLHRLAWR
jgi:hypothetical protein